MFRVSRASAVVLCALAGTCLAQADDLCTLPAQQLKDPPAGMRFLPVTEINQLVYAVTSPSDAPGTASRGTGGSSRLVNDAQFPNFPPAQGVTYPIAVNGVAFAWIAFGPNPGTGATFDYQVTFYDDITLPAPGDPNVCGAPAFYSNVLGTFRVNNIAPSWGFVQWFQDPLAVVDGLGNPATINFPDQSWAHETTIFHAGTDNVYRGTDPFTSVSQIVPLARGPETGPSVGTSNPQYWKNNPAAGAGVDANENGVEDYSEVCPAGTNGLAGSAAARRDVYLKLRADLPAPPPPSFTDRGTIDCASGPSTFDVEVVPGAVSWNRIELVSEASVAALSYLDIVAGDITGFTDASAGLYNVDGILMGADQDNGDLNQAFLTFGHGRRGPSGDSVEGDGRNGDLAPGVYYLAVCGGGASFGGSSFSVNASTTIDAGPVTVTMNHNTGASPCPLPDPVAPIATDLGTLPAGPTTAQILVGFRQVGWYTFTTTYDVLPDNANFLDITTTGTELGDSEIGLFSSTGALLGEDDDSADGVLSQLSFSGPAAPARPAAGDGLPREGQNGDTVPAGTYYLCVGLFNTTYGATGWQARSDSLSRLNINVNIF
ncbi:MAG: hypothetical protein JNK35_10095, partial [Phycisphaerae bacterium]|nr:hypothetical protein [Phycisphaerae bacterium]